MVKMNTYDYTVQYQDIDANGRLRLYTLENMILNASGKNADELGIGVHYLNQQGCTWVLISLALEIDYLPAEGQTITIQTWIEQNMHSLSMRNYRFFINNEQIGEARSVWAVLNIHERSIQNVFEQEAFLKIPTGERSLIDKTPRLMTVSEVQQQREHEVQYSDIDHNGHCNSCKYLEFMLNCFDPEYLTGAIRLDLRYAKEVRRGDKIRTVCCHDIESAVYEIFTESGEVSVSGRILKK